MTISVNHTKNMQVKGVEKEIDASVPLLKQEVTSKASLMRFLCREGVFLSDKKLDVAIYRRSKKKKRYVPLETPEDFQAMMRSLKVKNTSKLIVVDKLLDFKWLMDEKGLLKMKDVLNDYNKKILHVCSDFISALQSELDPSGNSNGAPVIPSVVPAVSESAATQGAAPQPADVKMQTDDKENKAKSESESESESDSSSPSPLKVPDHPSPTRYVSCDGCCIAKFVPMFGTIYHCEECNDFDLCGNCYGKQDSLCLPGHLSSHKMSKKFLPFIKERADASNTHPLVACDLCENDSFIVGDRYKCFQCPDFDLCGSCALGQKSMPRHKLGYHRPDHTMAKITTLYNNNVPPHCPRFNHTGAMPLYPKDAPSVDKDLNYIFADVDTENKAGIVLFFKRKDWQQNLVNIESLLEKARRYDSLVSTVEDDEGVDSETKFALLQSILEAYSAKVEQPVAVSMPVVEESTYEPAREIIDSTFKEGVLVEGGIDSKVEKISDFLTRITILNRSSNVLNGGDLSVQVYSNVGGQVYNKTINDFPPTYPGTGRKLNIEFGITDYNKFTLYVATGGRSFNWNYERLVDNIWIQVPPSEDFIVDNEEVEVVGEVKDDIEEVRDVEMTSAEDEAASEPPKYESETEAQLTDNETESFSEAEGVFKNEKSFVESIHAVILPVLPKESLSSSSSQVVQASTEFVDAKDEPDSPEEDENDDDYDMMSSDDGEPDLSEYEILSPVDSNPQ